MISDQVTDVRHHPIFTGLDEPVFVELPDILFDHLHLLGDDLQQGTQRFALLVIAHAIDGGKQFVEAILSSGVHDYLM